MNEYLKPNQLEKIKSLDLNVNTAGMDLGLAHNITVLINSIKNTITSLTSTYHMSCQSKAQNLHRFKILETQLDRLDGFMFEGLEGST